MGAIEGNDTEVELSATYFCSDATSFKGSDIQQFVLGNEGEPTISLVISRQQVTVIGVEQEWYFFPSGFRKHHDVDFTIDHEV